MLIAVSGVDCAGKSTQLDFLERALAARGHRVARVWYRPGYSRLLDTARAAVRRVRGASLPTADQPEARARAFSRPGVAHTWVAVALLDMAAQYAVRLRALQLEGRVVLCDRYVDDAMLDFEMRFPELDVERWPLARAVLAACPTPDASVLLTLPWETQTERMAMKNEPFPDPPNVRRRRFDRYAEIARSGRHTVVDARTSVHEVHRAVMNALAPCFGWPRAA